MSRSIEEVRVELLALARQSKRRTTDFSRRRPTKWQPGKVRNPDPEACGEPFTDAGAWEYVVQLLERQHPIKEIALKKPRGCVGYVMHVELGANVPKLYVKLELLSGLIMGRSFHPDTEPEDEDW